MGRPPDPVPSIRAIDWSIGRVRGRRGRAVRLQRIGRPAHIGRHWSRRRWFHTLRLAFWAIQIPPAITIKSIRESVPYLVFLSLAALVESAATDVDNARVADAGRGVHRRQASATIPNRSRGFIAGQPGTSRRSRQARDARIER